MCDYAGIIAEDLVFDVGLHNGDDAAYYMSSGYRVIGVEANPILAAQSSQRFKNEISQGLLVLLNVGILQEPGVFSFFRNLSNDSLSTFERERTRSGGVWEDTPVKCVTSDQLIAAYGRPFFMKIDVEGADFEVLRTLSSKTAPPLISVEADLVHPILERLLELGYTAFKLVNGETHRTSAPIFDHEIGWRLLRKTGRVFPFIRRSISRLPESWRPKSEFDPPGIYSPSGYPFSAFSSGPFGDQAAGPWLTPEAACRGFARLKEPYLRAGEDLWWDIHARHGCVKASRGVTC